MIARLRRRLGSRRRDRPSDPLRMDRLQAIVVAGIGFSLAAIPASQVVNADHPVAAAGIAVQTVAGLLATIQLWANSASDTLVRWIAHQIGINRWGVFGLFDGRIRSLLLASGWFLLGLLAVRVPLGWTPNAAVAWLIVVPALAAFLTGALVYFLAMFMMIGALVAPKNPPPDGEAVTSFHERLAANDWIWPLLGIAFVVGGMLQISAA